MATIVDSPVGSPYPTYTSNPKHGLYISGALSSSEKNPHGEAAMAGGGKPGLAYYYPT